MCVLICHCFSFHSDRLNLCPGIVCAWMAVGPHTSFSLPQPHFDCFSPCMFPSPVQVLSGEADHHLGRPTHVGCSAFRLSLTIVRRIFRTKLNRASILCTRLSLMRDVEPVVFFRTKLHEPKRGSRSSSYLHLCGSAGQVQRADGLPCSACRTRGV